MSTSVVLVGIGLLALVVLGLALRATRARVVALEAAVRRMEARMADDEAAIATAQGEARAASQTARRAARAAGVEVEPARLPLEPVAGRVVRVLAFGAGAKRAITRLATPRRRAA